ncbi:MAG: class I SAM-dependent methyltransferase [Deltaproteobacteria bacterium]|nr:class I SAM-dependent methyltransferase [Deltaproteobacteria bacterium]MDQ3296744.1 class I SAM-dependent methyltransferase [Myxococcota bacterium]
MHATAVEGQLEERVVPVETLATCDLCSGGDFEPRRVWRDELLFGPERWTLVRCKACNLYFINPRPTREVIGSFYPTDYAAHLAPPTQPKRWHRRVAAKDAAPISWWEKPILQVRQDLSWYRIPRWHGDGHVLDIGCGSGGRYLDVLKALGWTTYGIEPSPQAVANAVAHGHQAVVGTAEDAPFPDQSMDIVTMWHVLEHTHSPATALANCFRMLRPGGQLSLCVPNWAGMQAKLYGRFWWSCDAPRHLFQFTRKTLGRYLEQAGFRVVKVTTRTGPTSWQRAARHFLNNVFGTKWARDSSLLVDVMSPFCALGSLIRYAGAGAELRVIAERPS